MHLFSQSFNAKPKKSIYGTNNQPPVQSMELSPPQQLPRSFPLSVGLSTTLSVSLRCLSSEGDGICSIWFIILRK